MVEKKVASPENTAKPKPTAPITLTQGLRPKHAYLWTVNEVQKWFKRHCGEFEKYAPLFQQHEITGKALLRITDNTLLRMGINDNKDRETILREICKQKLKTDIVEFSDWIEERTLRSVAEGPLIYSQ